MRKKFLCILIAFLCISITTENLYAASKASKRKVAELTEELFEILKDKNTTPEDVKKLLDEGASLKAKYKKTILTPFFAASMVTAKPEILRVLIDAGANPKQKDNHGFSPFAIAASYNTNPEIMRFFIYDLGSDVNAKNAAYGFTPLMCAARRNPNPEIIKFLLRAGADIDAKDKQGFTAIIHAAANNSNPEVAQVLIDYGADPDMRTRGNHSARDFAKQNKNREMQRFFENL